VPVDDSDDDAGASRPPPAPDDRLWRHPSELSWAAPATAVVDPTPRPPRLWGVALTSGLTGAVLALGVVALVGGLGDDVTQRTVERVPADDVVSLASDARDGVPALAARVSPSVVRLDVTTASTTASGSGVVLRDDGTIVTNAHVVQGAREVMIVLADGTGVPGRVVGADRLTDVAVVVADDVHRGATAWVPAVFGSADRVEVGELAVAIGSPLGLAGGPSVTVGVVSGLGRRVAAEGLVLHDLIQTDAPIGEGSSGGALCDGAGVVVGITTALSTSDAVADGLGFAIPADVATAVAEQLLDGDVDHPWLGIEGADLAPTEASVPGVAGMGGVRVVSVDEGGPAAAAGLQADDVVIAFGGARIASMSDLVVALRDHRPGDVVEVEVRRGTDDVVVDVVLGERP
jgi:S1-C subfamily serine protease